MSVLRGLSYWTGTASPASPDYDAVGQNRRTTNWNPTTGGPNTVSQFSNTDLVKRSRDAIRRNGWASAAVETHVSNIVGTGIVPRPHGAEDFSQRVLELWSTWCKEADADNALDFYGLQSLVARSRFEAGDVFVRYRNRRLEDGLLVPVQLQIMESEQCDINYTELVSRNRQVVSGIEFDAIGRRTAYYFWSHHPGEFQNPNLSRIAVPASEVSHIYRPLRPGQVRGVPDLAVALLTLYDLDEVRDARIMREKIQNMLVGFLRKPAADMNPLGAGAPGTSSDSVPLASLEPATIQELLPGEDITMSSPPSQGAMADDFFRIHLQGVASSLGITYEQLTGDLSNVNFSAIRAGLIEVRRRFEVMQSQIMVHQFCRPVYSRFIEAAMISGALPVPIDFTARKNYYLSAEWHADAFEFVQPVDDIEAIVKKIRAGLMSRDQAAAMLGYDVETIDLQIQRDQERAEDLGIAFPDLQGGAANNPDATDADGDGIINE